MSQVQLLFHVNKAVNIIFDNKEKLLARFNEILPKEQENSLQALWNEARSLLDNNGIHSEGFQNVSAFEENLTLVRRLASDKDKVDTIGRLFYDCRETMDDVVAKTKVLNSKREFDYHTTKTEMESKISSDVDAWRKGEEQRKKIEFELKVLEDIWSSRHREAVNNQSYFSSFFSYMLGTLEKSMREGLANDRRKIVEYYKSNQGPWQPSSGYTPHEQNLVEQMVEKRWNQWFQDNIKTIEETSRGIESNHWKEFEMLINKKQKAIQEEKERIIEKTKIKINTNNINTNIKKEELEKSKQKKFDLKEFCKVNQSNRTSYENFIKNKVTNEMSQCENIASNIDLQEHLNHIRNAWNVNNQYFLNQRFNYIKECENIISDNFPKLNGDKVLIFFCMDMSISMEEKFHQNSEEEKKSKLDCLSSIYENITDMDFEDEDNIHLMGLGFGLKSKPACYDIQTIFDKPIGLQDWRTHKDEYKMKIDSFMKQYGGTTPMLNALLESFNQIKKIAEENEEYSSVFLFLITDGLPTDGTSEEIIKIASALKRKGVQIISTYLHNGTDLDSKTLYSECSEKWEHTTKLMYECASVYLNNNDTVTNFLDEKDWNWSPGFRMFTQVNHPDHLKNYSDISLLSSILNKI